MPKGKKGNKRGIIFFAIFLIALLRTGAQADTDTSKLRDPFFSPLWRWQLETAERAEKEKKDPKKIASALEIYDLTELKLVGIIVSANGTNKAVIETPDNKAFFLVKGTIIGKNDGTVEEITNNEVIIKETIIDYLGNENKNTITMKIIHPEDKEGLSGF